MWLSVQSLVGISAMNVLFVGIALLTGSMSHANEALLFLSRRDQEARAYVAEVNTSAIYSLVNYRGLVREALRSPDRNQLAFISAASGDFEVYIMEIGQVPILNHPSADIEPVWSPAGDRIAFVSNVSGNSEVYVVDVKSGQVRNLSNHPGSDIEPVWSPAGDRIAFASWRDNNREVYVAEIQTGVIRNLSNDPGIDAFPVWSPSGDSIAYISWRNETADIYIADVATGATHNLTNTPDDDEFNVVWLKDASEVTMFQNSAQPRPADRRWDGGSDSR